jgi:hypothetical protein
MTDTVKPVRNPLLALHELGRVARRAESLEELEFIAVNDTRILSPFRQAVFWQEGRGVRRLSGVVKLEANVPYVQWLNAVCKVLVNQAHAAVQISASDLPADLAEDWQHWLPAHAVWIPAPVEAGKDLAARELTSEREGGESIPRCGLLFARELPWSESQISLLSEWIDVWAYVWKMKQTLSPTWWRPRGLVASGGDTQKPWWRRRLALWGLGLLLVLCIPVRLTVLAPGELVPANPAVLRAPIEGVIDAFHVQPNDIVVEGQLLYSFDESMIRTRLAVIQQSLATAETEYRQAMQQALYDEKAKNTLRVLEGKIEERRAEFDYMTEQLERCQVVSPGNGIALFDDPSEWIGRPVQVGERIMRVAELDDVEIEAWLSISDAIPLEESSRVKLFLYANPTSPVNAELRYITHSAVQRPDLSYAYRLRAALTSPTSHQVGLKGTVRLHGRWVALGYWVLRRPIATLRSTIGW